MELRKVLVGIFIFVMSHMALAAGGPFGIDHKMKYHDAGIWAREKQKVFAVGSALVLVGGGLIEGSDTRLGNALSRSTDAMVVGDLSASTLNVVIRHQRPSSTDDPHLFSKAR